MLYKRKFVYKFLSRLYKLLDDAPDSFIYERLNQCIGKCDWKTIKVDPFHVNSNFVSVTIHEGLHWFYPEWKETKVLYHERKIMKRLSKNQLKRLVIKILNVI